MLYLYVSIKTLIKSNININTYDTFKGIDAY